VSVPKLSVTCYTLTPGLATYYCLPHIGACVDSYIFAMAFNSINYLLDILTIWSSIVCTPAASRWGVSFDINPNHSISIATCQSIDQLSYLGCCWLTSAREHVHVYIGQATSKCIIYVLASMCVYRSIRVVTSWNSEIVAITVKTLKGSYTCELGDIYSKSAINLLDTQQRCQE
jgi:hypothetical protein